MCIRDRVRTGPYSCIICMHVHLIQSTGVISCRYFAAVYIEYAYVILLAKHQMKSNAVDQLLSPVHGDDEWLTDDRTVRVLHTPSAGNTSLLAVQRAVMKRATYAMNESSLSVRLSLCPSQSSVTPKRFKTAQYTFCTVR